MSDPHAGPDVLIVGASQAGVQLATSLRESGAAGAITLVGLETCLPYQRPPLSKRFLKGTLPEIELPLRGAAFYAELEIDLVLGERVEEISLPDATHPRGTATSHTGKTFTFDRLALTVGGSARRLDLPGSDLPGIHYLRDLEDALMLRSDLAEAERVVVVGGGFVGLEAAAAATAAGKDVTVIESLPRLLARAVAPVTSDFYAEAHRRRGTKLLLGTAVAGFEGDTRVRSVVLGDGRRVIADTVVVGVGLVPNTRLAERLGIQCAGGIVVDEHSRTSSPAVVAAGDCTVFNHPQHGHLRVESVQNAIAQAKRAAATIAGGAAPDVGVPWFWSDQDDLKLNIAGLNVGYDDVVLRGDPDSERFSALYYKTGSLIAIDSVNVPRDYMAVRRILEAGGNVPLEAAADVNVPLKEFLTSKV